MNKKTNSLTKRFEDNYPADVPAGDEQYRPVIRDGSTVFNLIGAMHDGHTEDHA